MKVYKFVRDFIFLLLLTAIFWCAIYIAKMVDIIDSNVVHVNRKIPRPEENQANKYPVDTPENRIKACEENAGFYLNFGEWEFTWEDEEEAGASFVRNGHVVYEKWGEKWEADIECLVDMVDGSVNVEFKNHVPVDDEYPAEYVKTSLTNDDIDHIEEILPPLSYDYEIWNMEDETLISSGHYDYPAGVENWYVFIPEHATMASREIVSSGIEDGMIYTLTNVTLQDDTVVSVLYIHDPETLFVRAITVENGHQVTYYRNFLYNADVE